MIERIDSQITEAQFITKFQESEIQEYKDTAGVERALPPCSRADIQKGLPS